MLGFCRFLLRTAQILQADLLRSWTAPPVESLDARYQSLRTRWIPGSWQRKFLASPPHTHRWGNNHQTAAAQRLEATTGQKRGAMALANNARTTKGHSRPRVEQIVYGYQTVAHRTNKITVTRRVGCQALVPSADDAE